MALIRYALFDANDAFVRDQLFDDGQYVPPAGVNAKGNYWRRVVDTPPSFDDDIETRAATGWTIGETTATRTYSVAAKNLAALKASYAARVKADAEAERARYITAGSGKALEYREKVSELAAWAADPADPKDPAGYPLFAAEATGLGITLAAARARVATAYGQWKAIGAAILAVEMAAGKAIEDAADGAGVKAAYAAIAWPDPE